MSKKYGFSVQSKVKAGYKCDMKWVDWWNVLTIPPQHIQACEYWCYNDDDTVKLIPAYVNDIPKIYCQWAGLI